MKKIQELFKLASKSYNNFVPHYDVCLSLVLYCQKKLQTKASYRPYGAFNGKPAVSYNVFEIPKEVSRPVRSNLYITDGTTFLAKHAEMVAIIREPDRRWTMEDRHCFNCVVYTAVMSVACCFDLWKRTSRKTPGTFFEVYIAGLLQLGFPDAVLSKHIPIAALLQEPEATSESIEDGPADEEFDSEGTSVSTDVVISLKGRRGGIVIPLKITTRERIVQPFAHQRILDSAFGKGVYKSMVVCMSETQLDDKTQTVKQICVPGTIKLFQRYLANIDGIYYCDLPHRYVTEDMLSVINIRSFGQFFEDLRSLLDKS